MPTAPDADPSRPQHAARRPQPGATSDAGRASRSHLTGRGGLAVTLIAGALVLLLIGLGLHFAHRSHRDAPRRDAVAAATPAASTSPTRVGATSSTASSPAASSSRAAATASALLAGATRDTGGYVHSNYPPSGHFVHSTITMAAHRHTGAVHTFIVEVETSLPRVDAQLAPNAVAAEIDMVLNDPRGWTGMRSGPVRGVGFQLVDDPARAQFVIHLATAQTVNRMCPLDTLDLWSCDAGTTVLLNADRWLYATPFYPSVQAYREYQVNHEVGHFLGFGHQYTCGPHGMAPTMMQQSKGLHGCRANPWPTVA